MVWILNGIWKPEAQPFEFRTNGRQPFFYKPFEIWVVGPIALAIAKARPFENLTILISTFKKLGFQMDEFQMPIVYVY